MIDNINPNESRGATPNGEEMLTQRRRGAERSLFHHRTSAPLRLCVRIFAIAVALHCVFGLAIGNGANAEAVSFKRDIAPIVLNNCLACHGPKKSEGGYRIDTFERVMAPGDSTQPGFVAKDLEGS